MSSRKNGPPGHARGRPLPVRYKRHGINRSGAAMELEILQVTGCPGADMLDARLAELGYPRVIRRVVTSQAEAERLGLAGSTLLVDGADPFARPASCRLSRAACTPTSTDGRAPRPHLGSSATRSRSNRLRNSGERRRASATRRAVPKVLTRRRKRRPPPWTPEDRGARLVGDRDGRVHERALAHRDPVVAVALHLVAGAEPAAEHGRRPRQASRSCAAPLPSAWPQG